MRAVVAIPIVAAGLLLWLAASSTAAPIRAATTVQRQLAVSDGWLLAHGYDPARPNAPPLRRTSDPVAIARPSAATRAWSVQREPSSSRTPVVAAEGGGADFVVDSRGTAIPTDAARLQAGLEDSGAFQDVSTNPATSRKFVGLDDGDPIRIRVEKGHFDDPSYTGPEDPLHAVDHLHVERRANGATGPWTEIWKIPYEWPF